MEAWLTTLGYILMVAGIALVFFAAMLLIFSSMRVRRRVRGGGAVLIGPFPIIFGTDKESMKIVVILTIVLMIIATSLILIPFFLR